MNLSDSRTAGKGPRRVGAMEAVLAHLRCAIERGEYALGAKLPAEAHLAGQLGVSRSVIREALRGLQALGMTESRTGRGTFVIAAGSSQHPGLRSHSTTNLLAVCRHIEIPAARYAALRRGVAELAELAELGDLLERMAAEPGDTAWVALDSRLHAGIARASGNPVFAEVVGQLHGALAGRPGFLDRPASGRARSNAEHRRIVAAIAEGSPGAAAAAMSDHLDHVEISLTTTVRTPRTARTTGEHRNRD